MRFSIALLFAAALCAALYESEARNLRRRRQAEVVEVPTDVVEVPTDVAESQDNAFVKGLKKFGNSIKLWSKKSMNGMKDSMSTLKEKVAEASKQISTDPAAYMKKLQDMLPTEFFNDVLDTLKSMGLEPNQQNVEYVLQFSLVAAGVPSFFADKMAKALTPQIFKMLGIQEPTNEDKTVSTGVTVDLTQISENNGNLNLELIPGSKATLGEPMADGRTPVHLQIVGDLEYVPPVKEEAKVAAIENF